VVDLASSLAAAADPAPSSSPAAYPTSSPVATADSVLLGPGARWQRWGSGWGERIDGGDARPRCRLVWPRSRPVRAFSFFVYFNQFAVAGKATTSIAFVVTLEWRQLRCPPPKIENDCLN
jgi:hypothetical protein